MRFLRHHGIYRSDVSFLLVSSGGGAASRWSGPAQAIGRDGRSTPCPSSAMSSGRLFLDRVARQQSPSPLHRHPQLISIAGSLATNYHRTVNSRLTGCLTLGVHRTLSPMMFCLLQTCSAARCRPTGGRTKRPSFAFARFPLLWGNLRNGPERSRARGLCAAQRTLEREDRSGTSG